MYTQSFFQISTYHWKLHQPIKVTHTPIMFFHFKLVIAVTTSKDISSNNVIGKQSQGPLVPPSWSLIPQEMPAPPSLLLKHHYRKLQF